MLGMVHKVEKAMMAAKFETYDVDWGEMMAEELGSCAAELKEVQSAFGLLQVQKDEADEYLAEFEAVSIEEFGLMEGKLEAALASTDAALVGKAAADQRVAELELELAAHRYGEVHSRHSLETMHVLSVGDG